MAEDRPSREGVEWEDNCLTPVGSDWKVVIERVVDLDPFTSVRVYEIVVDSQELDVFDGILDALRRDGWDCSIVKSLCRETYALCTRRLVVKPPITREGGPVQDEITTGLLLVGYLFLGP
ncbi:MAG: hypothetical protein GSR78_00390 [Desulfurococcales archaeon]|nr:hypothetical protein [Desulfurococcales archaeon]